MLEKMFDVSPERMAHMIWHMAKYWRFSISIYTSLEGLIMDYPDMVDKMADYYEQNPSKFDVLRRNLFSVYSELYMKRDEQAYRKLLLRF